MKRLPRFAILAAILASAALPVRAEEITRVASPNPAAPLAAVVIVPPGATTYYISGGLPDVADPKAPKGTVEAYGDTAAQVASILEKLKKTLAPLGLAPGDVVQARVFLLGDPAKNDAMDFAGLNAAWAKVFGTAEQPNKPARTTVKAAGLVLPGALVEIEFVAAKVK
ncbi:MAG TPA: RidA family protein [Rhizomicrobium sp.]